MSGNKAAHSQWVKASELHIGSDDAKHAPLQVSCLNSLFPNGLERGSVIEISGPRSSGKTSVSHYILSASIRSEEICAYIDLNNEFSPSSITQQGASIDFLSWIRCNGNTDHAMRATDLILHSGGFGLVVLDLTGASFQTINRIPLSYWFRFQRAIDDTPTILLICGEYPQARSCSRQSVEVVGKAFHWKGKHSSFSIIQAIETTARPTKSRVTSIRPISLYIPAAYSQGGV